MKFYSPLAIILPRKTKKDRRVALNLNTYRNLHYLVNNSVKHIYCELMREQLSGFKFKTPIALQFELHRQNKRKGDRANVLCIVEKFFCDALVHYGCIPDDNDEHIQSSYYMTSEIDKENPRVDIWIRECGEAT